MTTLLRTLNLFKNRIIFLFILSLFAACIDKNTVYNKSLVSYPKGWTHTDSLKWIASINDSASFYEIGIGIRNDYNYKYQNIGLEFTIIDSSDSVLYKDTLDIRLTNDDGKWKEKGWGSLINSSTLIKSKYSFPVSGDYLFVVRQAMKDHNIYGIESINLKISKE
ncbi:MAG: gliding motility lipoprotein GldH [Bacteroidales bacterium]|nr:gliding motility lipoprotein GldH [Bacteroidales bacterium]